MSKTHVGFILDMSGSMSGIAAPTVEGVVGYVNGLRKDLGKKAGDVQFNLTIFDTIFEPWLRDATLPDVKIEKVMKAYRPRGGTALYDAIGKTVSEMKSSVKKEDKAIVVIMTDGHENSSTEWDRAKVNKLVTKLTKRGNWTFVYMGANVDSYAEAAKLGVMKTNSGSYSASRRSVGASFAAMSHSTVALARSESPSSSAFYADAGEEADVRDEKEKANSK